ncbi:MAG TPA: amylo-alpha-1,6-glucosidase [Verrucomicrobiae bacterium]|nr:amylo-alpha-1,6-glucosidase [Verrucomicrobiae bacterium]
MEPPLLILSPAPGERLRRFVGDKVLFSIRAEKNFPKNNLRAFLRTNLGRSATRRHEIIAARAAGEIFADESWRDLPMRRNGDVWEIELPLPAAGYFKAKAYLRDEKNWQHWPDGSDVGISVHPDFARTANTIYCAFTRLFGATKNLASTADEKMEAALQSLEALGYATLPPSGKFRDLARQLPHIVQKLGCKIIHLLPVHPTPTTYARFGRFGSPYAALDLTAVDPELVEFDKRTTGIDQFCELTSAAHALGARVFIDIVINHTGWGSTLQENHPQFFLKKPDGEFASPGAWGTVWEDLVELEQNDISLWDIITESLLIWCRRGVDGFRCDAGYKIPVAAWQYIIARVQDEFPETIFLLEGLGGSWEATENLLTEGGMQWAYSELFQNYSGKDVAWYLDYANRQNERIGTYIHYSETHDNNRLAAQSSASILPANPNKIPNRVWSLLRNRLCALTSSNGGFGFTCGVEWLATEKIRVHGCTGLNWDSPDNIISELAQLNQLLAENPCFFDGAKLTRLSEQNSPIYALLRESAEGKDSVLILANTDAENSHALTLRLSDLKFQISDFQFDLLNQPLSQFTQEKNEIIFTLAPGAVHCLAPTENSLGLSGENYRCARAQAAFAVQALNQILPAEKISNFDWPFLAEQIENSPQHFLAASSHLHGDETQVGFSTLIQKATRGEIFPNVITWTLIDARRVMPVPANHWLLIEDSSPFRATLQIQKGEIIHVQSTPAGKNFIAVFPPRENFVEAELILERYATTSQKISAAIRFLAPAPSSSSSSSFSPSDLILLTNGIGGMARLCVDLGRVNSKYDCILAANLNPHFPVDRHIFVKRIRVWVNADGFLSPLDFKNLAAFQPGSPAVWNFVANAGDGRTVEIKLRAEMLAGKNTIAFQFSRPTEKSAHGKQLPANADVRLTVRFDIEDRNFHQETKHNSGADFHFSSNTHLLPQLPTANSHLPKIGFAFTPAQDRQLRIFSDAGEFHPQPEWSENIPHPVEATRGQIASGDAYSPGWFEIPLAKGSNATLVATAEISDFPRPAKRGEGQGEGFVSNHSFENQLLHAAKQFVVRRDDGKTIIAGYPWFLDWGRDSLICARGLLASGMVDEVKSLLLTFAKFEKDGTLPNTIHGNDVSNRDTSDAPLWFALTVSECADMSALCSTRHVASKKSDDLSPHSKFYQTRVNENGRTIFDVLRNIAENYSCGTTNSIRMDADSALIWSPAHFTWMDTNFPVGTPREGYPVEIQVLWIRLLRQLEKISPRDEQKKWRDLADRATTSFEKLFWLENQGWFADVLLAKKNIIARDATPSDALRSNCLFAISLGLISGERAKRCVAAAQKLLVVPGALRTLAPLPVSVPLAVYGNDGRLLNNPAEPYWPHYEGDEDTRRKPAYHNGTAWVWTFPVFCEALARAWNFSPEAMATAKSYLTSAEKLLNEGCLGQLPEILDGDAPHTQRGCDAQAWSATEFLRVWNYFQKSSSRDDAAQICLDSSNQKP